MELKVFNNEVFGNVEVVLFEGKEWFAATSIAKALGYKNPHDAISKHCNKDGLVKREVVDSLGRKQDSNFINEGNVYRLIAKSKLPEAIKFEKWIFEDILPSIRKTGGYVSNDEMFIEAYLPYADETTKLMFKSTLETVRKQNELIEKQKNEIHYKEDVIIGLVDEISLAEKRQILNRVVRCGGNKIQERWTELYKQFEMKYHINLKRRIESYNKINKPKIKNKLEYIDKVMNKVSDLYDIACKIYENDVKKLAEEMYALNNR